ncbi:hypothetical protein [Roseateles sp. YR242]|uniref:hypothetical protein n=1 Tax=Roseateles sp. YR242 TaxID=1855305 RepID=UPI0011609847|nr:hypothetical protein [Roseateles sp. YR242]
MTPPPKPPRAIPPAALADVGFDPLDVPSVPTLADLHSEPPRHELKVPNPARPNAAARAFEAGFDKLAEQLQTDPEVDLFAPSMVPSVSKAQEAQINALADQLAQWPLETESVVPIPSRVPILSKADEAQYYDLVEELLGVDDTAASLRAASSNGEVPIGFEKVDDRDLSDGYLRPVTAGVQPATGTVESPDGLLPAHVKVAADHVDAQGGEDLDIYEEIGPLPAKAAPPPPPYLAEPPPYTAPALPPRLVKTAPSIQNLDAGRKPEKAAALVSAVDEEVSVPRDIAARWKANPSGDAMMAAVVSEMVATLQARPSVGQRVLGFFGKPPAESARTDAFHELVLERLTGSVNQMRSDFQASAPGLTKAEVRREREDFVESQLVEKLQASLTSLPRAARDRVLERLGNENDQILTAIRRSRDLNLVFLRQNPKARNMHMAGLREAVFTQSRLLNAFKRLTKEAADAT